MSDVLQAVIGEAQSGARLDKAMAELFSDYSRSFLQDCIRRGCVLVDGDVPRVRDLVAAGARIVFRPPATPANVAVAEALPLAIVHEDDELLVIDKPPGMVVHPGAGHARGTVLNAVLHHSPQTGALPRAGIVQRLDKDTSGLMVVAKTRAAHQSLTAQLRARSLGRRYLALVCGRVIAGGTIEAPVGRHPRERKRMAVRNDGRVAVTHYRVARRYPAHTLLEVALATGRTHQIRVHMAHIGHAVFGDPVYAGRPRPPAGATPDFRQALCAFRRQALHAAELSLLHPGRGIPAAWRAEAPEDLRWLLDLLAQAQSAGGSDG